MIKVVDLGYEVRRKNILQGVNFQVQAGEWLAILGENGSGKTTLLDLLMGFKAPTQGTISILGNEPGKDPWIDRQKIAYLSEKVDLPGDVSIGDFLRFNSYFYPGYDPKLEDELCATLRVSKTRRVGNLSAGEIRRAQIVGALSYRPQLILIDEITAVLDIVGRRRLMTILRDRAKEGSAIVFATNILEGLHGHVQDILLLAKGSVIAQVELKSMLQAGNEADLCDRVAGLLEASC